MKQNYAPICANCVEREDGLELVVYNGRTVLLCPSCRNGQNLRSVASAGSVSQREPSRGVGAGNKRSSPGIGGR